MIPHSERQYVHSLNVLSNHPPELTDSFVLVVKSAILLSRVKAFNRRFRKLNALGVSDMSVKGSSSKEFDMIAGSSEESQSHGAGMENSPDAREVDRFVQLETEVESFTRSFPAYLQEPITQDGFVDWTLLNAYLASYVRSHSAHPAFTSVFITNKFEWKVRK